MEIDDVNPTPEERSVFLPSQAIDKNEKLVCDKSAYVLLHQARTGAPCLSFDIISDYLGERRELFPLTAFAVAGTQSDRTHMNHVIVMKMSNIHKTQKDSEDSDEESESESDDEAEQRQPQLDFAMIKHQGCVNRIRVTSSGRTVMAASWSELGRVNIWNLSPQLEAVNDSNLLLEYSKGNQDPPPLFTFSGHQTEGFAVDWCPTMAGVLATGDCNRNIHVWHPKEGGAWNVDQRPLIGHTASVEDLQWSPTERHVLASCSVDRSIRIWDSRASPNKACMLTAENTHESDVNVISWNRNEPLIVSGGDDGKLLIWDLRHFQEGKAVATFKHHTDSVTTVEWHPTEGTIFASGGADDQISLWDLAVEKDMEAGDNVDDIEELAPQLLFIHQGQKEIKELHWHPQIPGLIISTAHSGFNIFRTISV